VVTFTKKISFLRRAFGHCELDRKKENAIFVCPSCGRGTGKRKFYINLDTWQCHCWSCGLKGKTILSVLRKYGTREDVELFLNILGKKGSISPSEKVEGLDEKVTLPEGFILLADHQRSIDPDVRSCIRYLASRGLRERDLWRYRFGTVRSGRFKRRIIVPSFDMFGDLNFFVTRSIDPGVRRKYINSNNNKKNIVFNEIDIDWSAELVLVEGPFDMVKAGENCACILGSSLTDDHLLFSRIVSNQTPVVLALDADMKEKQQEIAKNLSSYGCEVKIASLGDFSDVGDMSREEFKNAMINSIPWSPSQRLKMRIGSLRSGSLF
tara:strand:+ start:6912 stop:7880 length:969 start_codon:yes stop_codon:yes gene_type:complete